MRQWNSDSCLWRWEWPGLSVASLAESSLFISLRCVVFTILEQWEKIGCTELNLFLTCVFYFRHQFSCFLYHLYWILFRNILFSCFYCIYLHCVYSCCGLHWEVRGWLKGVYFPLPPCDFWQTETIQFGGRYSYLLSTSGTLTDFF